MAVRRHSALVFIATAFAVLLTLAGCSPAPDAEETRDSLVAVTTEPDEDADASETYDIELHPEPFVAPLDCTPYLVLTARGTAEPRMRDQLLSPVARAIERARPEQVQVVDVDYPADTDVRIGGTRGVRVLLDTLNQQAERCVAQEFILLGYSQGALIVGDAISKPEFRLVGEATGQLSIEAADRILAVLLYGNPRFNGSETYAYGSFTPGRGGILPREPGTLAEFADRMQDFCVAEDFVCQSSLDLDEEGHVAYFSNGMQSDGAAFVIMLLSPERGSDPDDDRSEDAASPSHGRDALGEFDEL